MLGGTPRCAACGQLAYHAEQVMGPGRKIYHKPCLQCLNCKKRLDPGSLVEHDAEPYCKRCHGLLFGTRDLRSANVFSSSSNAPPTTPPRNASQQSSPRVNRTVSPVRRTDYQSLSAQASPGRGMESHVAAETLLSARRFSRQSTEEPSAHTAGKGETPSSVDKSATDETIKKRPLPPLPPKPLSFSATAHAVHTPAPTSPSIFKQAGKPVLPTRHVDHQRPEPTDADAEEQASVQATATKVYSSIDELVNEPHTPLIPESPAPALPERHTQYTSLDDAVADSTPSMAQLHLHDNSPVLPSHPKPHQNQLLASSPYRSKPIMPARSSPSGNEGCAGCGKTVYFAEGVNAIGTRWHKPCLKCASCRTTLDPGRVQDRDEMPYCKNCYTRDFGPTVLR